jgi:hypothetical protein
LPDRRLLCPLGVNRAAVAQGGPPFHFRYAQEADSRSGHWHLARRAKTDGLMHRSKQPLLFDHLVGKRKPLGRHVEADITSHPDSHDEQPHFDTEVVFRSEDIDLK